ncbi:MAG: tetratricopeptide repeat protein [Chloroflexota bacterium]|nr:tetratricopeptide repeat protein [Chloroflexota bacterium]
MANTKIAVKDFQFDPNGSPDGVLLEITGRTAGIVGFILDALKLGTTSSLSIRQGEVHFRFSNLAGTEVIMCPFNAIRCAEGGVSKPFWNLVIGLVIALYGLFSLNTNAVTGVVVLLIGGAIAATYFLSKDLYITFSTGSMTDTQGLAFSEEIINGNKLNLEMILDAIDRINNHLVSIHTQPAGTASRTLRDRIRSQPASWVTQETSVVQANDNISVDEAERAEVAYQEGLKFYKMELYETALPYLQQAIKLKTDHANAHGCLARCYIELDKANPGKYTTLAQKHRQIYRDLTGR